MKYFLLIMMGLCVTTLAAYCQFPMRSQQQSNVSMIMLPIVQEETEVPNYLVGAGLKKVFSKAIEVNVEFSTIERIYPHAVSYASWTTALSTDVSIKKSFQSQHVQFSGFTVWDRIDSKAIVNVYTGQWKNRFSNSATLLIQGEVRNEDVIESFSITEEVDVAARNHKFSNLSIYYTRNGNRKLSEYMEITVGEHYGYQWQALRIGERVKVLSLLTLYADVEFNRVGNEGKQGALARMKVDWKVSQYISVGVFSLHNTFNLYSAFMGQIQYRFCNHAVKLEYRELRDPNFNVVVTSGFWFASRVLFQYTFTLG